MPFLRYLPVVVAVGSGLAVLAGAGHHTTAPEIPVIPFTPPPPAVPADAACQVLAAAVRALEPDRVAWLETTIEQRVRLPGLEYEAEGCYRAAPNNRYRLELRTHVGKSNGLALAVSDGANVWRATRVGDGAWTSVRRAELRQSLDGSDGSPQAHELFLRGPAFSGPAPLLNNLQRRLVWAKRTEVRLSGQAAIELTGVWPAAQSAALAPKDAAWPSGLPDRCLLLLDAGTLWPRRVEWWGPSAEGKGMVCLVQMELRDPLFNHPLPAEECSRAFTFQPGLATVVDETSARMETATAPKQPSAP